MPVEMWLGRDQLEESQNKSYFKKGLISFKAHVLQSLQQILCPNQLRLLNATDYMLPVYNWLVMFPYNV